jgi:hypothetical protein
MLRRPKNRTGDGGFTMIEMILSAGIILATVGAFAVFITATSSIQTEAAIARNAERVLAAQVEDTYAIPWDNLMMSNPQGVCALGPNVLVLTAIRSGGTGAEEAYVQDNVRVSITRTVHWMSDFNPQNPQSPFGLVQCTDADRYRADLKAVTVTAKWNARGEARTKSVTVLRSRLTEAPVLNR